MWVLFLNDMRSKNFENVQPVARAESREALEAFVTREKVATYSEPGDGYYGPTTWGKSFRRGGPLEWFNVPSPSLDAYRDLGMLGDQIVRLTAEWETFAASLVDVGVHQ